MRVIRLAAAALILVAGLAACGNDSPASPGGSTNGNGGGADTVTYGGQKGCAAVSQAEAEAAAGTTLGTPTETLLTDGAVIPPVIENFGCVWNTIGHAASYFADHYTSSEEAQTPLDVSKGHVAANNGQEITVGGFPGVTWKDASGETERVVFKKGYLFVTVSVTNGADGAPKQIAELLAARL